MKNKIKIWLGLVCFLLLLTGINSTVYAVGEADLKAEMEKAYQEFKATNPEAAQEFIKEYREALISGEIIIEKMDDAEKMGVEKKDTAYDDNEPVERREHYIQMGNEFDKLLKEGKTSEEAEKIMREKYGEPPEDVPYDLTTEEGIAEASGDFIKERKSLEEHGMDPGRLDVLEIAIKEGKQELVEKMFDEIDKEMGYDKIDRYGPEFDRPDFDHFREMGLSDGDLRDLKDAISRGDEDAADEIIEKMGPEFDRPEFDRPELFDRPEYDFEHMSPEERDKIFREEMGRDDPTDSERDMMERGSERHDGHEGFDRDYDRDGFDRDYDRDGFDRDYDRDGFDREDHEYEERDREEFDREERDREPPERENEPPPEEEHNP